MPGPMPPSARYSTGMPSARTLAQLLPAVGGDAARAARLREAGEVALHVCCDDGDACLRELLRHSLKPLRLAGAGRARDQPVTVHHPQRDLDDGSRMTFPSRTPWPSSSASPWVVYAAAIVVSKSLGGLFVFATRRVYESASRLTDALDVAVPSRPPRIVATEMCVAPSARHSSASARQSSGVPSRRRSATRFRSTRGRGRPPRPSRGTAPSSPASRPRAAAAGRTRRRSGRRAGSPPPPSRRSRSGSAAGPAAG